MKIAQIAPLYESVPPRLYGGTERVVSYLTDALVELGHDVTLFTSADAKTKAKLIPMRDQAIRLDPSPRKSELAAHLIMMDAVRRAADFFDVLHFHTDVIHMPLFEDIAERTLTTIHGRLDVRDIDRAYRRWSGFSLISISDQQRHPLPDANWLGTVHHGLPTHLLKFSAEPKSPYLAFLGRISEEKRPDRAIALARRTGIPLKIAAKIDSADESYFRGVIAPMLEDPGIEFIGEINEREKSDFLGNALALVFPIDWPEPFGLVMIEAMACGTPVLAWNCGSVPEVVEPGLTGEIVNSEDEAVAALERISKLDRRKIRRAFELRFSATVMARHYVEYYERLSAGTRMDDSVIAAG
jgi:glycosyltransferase involved in cell wall biosynthesis